MKDAKEKTCVGCEYLGAWVDGDGTTLTYTCSIKKTLPFGGRVILEPKRCKRFKKTRKRIRRTQE
jgi:hypothetical protein